MTRNRLTKAQQESLKIKYDQWKTSGMTYLQFRRSVVAVFGKVAMVRWCGMWLGIETDGYTHS